MGLVTKIKLTPAVLMGIAAGILLLFSGTTGLATWTEMGELATEHLPDNTAVEMTFRVLMFMGALGGGLVIAGAYFIGTERIDTGRLLITIGVGTGLIGTVMLFWSWSKEKPEVVTIGFIMGLAGITLSVVARQWAKHVKKKEQEKEAGN